MVELNNNHDNRISVSEAAHFLGTSEQFVRIGLQQGTLKFGMAVKMSSQWTYVITKQKFEEITRIKELYRKVGMIDGKQYCKRV